MTEAMVIFKWFLFWLLIHWECPFWSLCVNFQLCCFDLPNIRTVALNQDLWELLSKVSCLLLFRNLPFFKKNSLPPFFFFFLNFILIQVEVSRFPLSKASMGDRALKFNTLCKLMLGDGAWTTYHHSSTTLCCRCWTVLLVQRTHNYLTCNYMMSWLSINNKVQTKLGLNFPLPDGLWSRGFDIIFISRIAWIFFANRWSSYSSKDSSDAYHV